MDLPRHVAIIMDGNGRWATQRGNARSYGHANGKLPVRESIKGAIRLGIPYLTLYAFSSENWKRPAEEVDTLMELLVEAIGEYLDELCEQGVRLATIGDLRALPEGLQQELARAKRETSGGDKLLLTVALNYGGRQEIVRAVQRYCEALAAGQERAGELDASRFAGYLDTAGIPDPELLIRTGGEQRLSNFLLWQVAYCEFVYLPILWPDFRESDFVAAVEAFGSRHRRFGGI